MIGHKSNTFASAMTIMTVNFKEGLIGRRKKGA
jgi:hypothetical protein